MDGTDSATARHEDEAKRNTNGTADVIDRKGFAETYTVEECCEILDSQRVPIKGSERSAGEYPYYGANGIQDYVDDYIFDDELVLLAEDGGNFGSKIRPIAYRVSGKCWVNNHAHVLKPKSMIDVDYLCYSLMFYDKTVDVIWFNERRMPYRFYEVEHSTNITNSLDKFYELQDFRADFYIIADESRKSQFNSLIERNIYSSIRDYVKFFSYDHLVNQYTKESELIQMDRL